MLLAVNRFTIPGGVMGARATLAKMRGLVNASLTDPVVIQTARSVIAFAPTRDRDAHVRSVRTFLNERFQFVRDPTGVELLATPRVMLDTIARRFYVQGDCDDAAILTAALGKVVGLRARFRAVAFHPGAPFSHVYALLRGNLHWYNLDVTRSPRAPDATLARVLTVEV